MAEFTLRITSGHFNNQHLRLSFIAVFPVFFTCTYFSFSSHLPVRRISYPLHSTLYFQVALFLLSRF
ncbi:hypothetical protein BDQ12DRAFT_685083 [Crucibulum laeve]|uniref:Uncharacterized protein n=1 Tax=Crucibulum laeve TaxID=68775 RepID=A0A5C3LZ35_9AGAR|nr:hypothetical protein BDQ12DRAFT_685083 [Crucibulum laeve]